MANPSDTLTVRVQAEEALERAIKNRRRDRWLGISRTARAYARAHQAHVDASMPATIRHPDGRKVTRADFVAFLRGTLIPDLRDSGLDATADDFEAAVLFMLDTDRES